MLRAVAVALSLGMVLSVAPAVAGSCAVATGEAVMLRSSDFDPNVLVWDSRQRAIDYVSGELHSEAVVLVHTLLSRPGTRAIVMACDPASAKPRYATATEDTIGIKITTGPNRGRYGWISSGDAHGLNPAMAASP